MLRAERERESGLCSINAETNKYEMKTIHNKLAVQAMMLLLIGLCLLFVWTPVAEAHSSLLESVPGNGQVLDSSPSSLILHFNEPVEYDLATITVYDWNGSPILIENPKGEHERSKDLEVPMPELDQGTYTVKWDIVSLDGHPVNGSYIFAVGEATEGAIQPADKGKDNPSFLVIARTIVEGLLLLGAGLYWFSWFAERRGLPGIKTVFSKGRSILAIILIVGTLAELAAYAFTLPSGLIQTITGGRWDLLFNFPFVIMLFVQLFLVILLFIPGMVRGWYLFMWMMLAAVPSFGGHVWSMEHPYIALIPRIFHQLAIALWLGALCYLILVLIHNRKQKRDMPTTGFRGFFVTHVAIASGLVVVSGIIMVYLQTGWTAVFTDWGNWSTMLLVKVILTVLMLSIALFQTLKWRKQQIFSTPRLIRIEWIAGLVIILFGVWMSQSSYPLPVKSYVDILSSGNVQAEVVINNLQQGEQQMTMKLPDEDGDMPDQVTIDLSMPEHGMGAKPATAEPTDSGDYQAKLNFSMSGSWEFVIHAEYPNGESKEWKDSIFVTGTGN
ncbi:copper transport protein [Virgibacillus halotolerans]|uniref:copper resistance protein CopC n=1 Tax=Virgibacillus halotolerans TaxID=1071053 RepID=UPI00196110DB|nr:copper transport protein [Virgibacillus halotolerans]